MKTVGLEGQRFTRLVVLRRIPNLRDRNALYECRCDCGSTHRATGSSLAAQKVRSCGCLAREAKSLRPNSLRHGMTYSKTWYAWKNMRERCRSVRRHDYYRYGGRGIRVCDHWQIFENFLADMGEAPAEKSLDRIDVNGNYEPGNCRWATAKEQAINRRPRTKGYHKKKTIARMQNEVLA